MKIDGQKLFELLRDEQGTAEANRIIGKLEALSKEKYLGDPAFPKAASEYEYGFPGIRIRDYFAAKAMQGFCADPTNHKIFADQADAAESAYAMADAMLKAREAAQ